MAQEATRKTREITYTEAIRQALLEEMERDERVFVMGQDVGAYGGLFGATAGLQEKFGKKRCFDTPISETFITGGGVGAAITGLRPVVELQFADFVAIAMDEIYDKAAKWRYMHGGLFTVPLVIRAAEGAMGGAGPEHSQCPEALFWSAAGLYVLTTSVVLMVMPSVDETPADFPGAVLYDFRVAALGNQVVLWVAIGLLFGWLTDRSLRRTPPVETGGGQR